MYIVYIYIDIYSNPMNIRLIQFSFFAINVFNQQSTFVSFKFHLDVLQCNIYTQSLVDVKFYGSALKIH